jgi:lipoprotein NlpI
MRFALLVFLPFLAFLAVGPQQVRADTVSNLLKQAGDALVGGKPEEALTLAGKAIALDPKSAPAYFYRATIYERLQRHAKAIADLDKAVELEPEAAFPYDLRGSEHFKLGDIKQSLADFDKFLELKPDEKAGHWKRGISCYYAGLFAEGQKQFEDGEKVFADDVENAVWRYLCMARLAGVEKARKALLKVEKDRRVPMMEVYALFGGRAKPEDVLAAAEAGKPPPADLNQRLFYAHLYLGLYYDAKGDKQKAVEHLTEAAERHKVGHYMWDVARVHLERLRKEAKGK